MTDRYDQGMKTRRRVLGDAHVDRAEAAKTDADIPMHIRDNKYWCIAIRCHDQ